jgi:hypothetical protein
MGASITALTHLKEALSDQADFQTYSATANQAAAKARIQLHGLDDISNLPTRSCVVLRVVDVIAGEKVAIGTFGPPTIVVLVIAEIDISDASDDDLALATVEAENAVELLRTALQSCDNYSYDGTLLRVANPWATSDGDEQLGRITWPEHEEAERVTADHPYPFCQVRGHVRLGAGE